MNLLSGGIKVDFRSGEPLFLQIARQIEQLVAAGELKVGDQLPTVRQLATELRINFNTVSRAYHLLDEAGLISTQHGRGTYVWEQPTPEIMAQLRQSGLESLTASFLSEAERLKYTPREVRDVFERQISRWEQSEKTEKTSTNDRQGTPHES